MDPQLDPRTREFYRQAILIARRSDAPFLVAGAYAMERYTGIARHTKDFDMFIRRGDVERVFRAFEAAGYRTELTFPHWLGKVYHEDAYIDLIFSTGNGIGEVDDLWFEHAVVEEVLGMSVAICPAEEIIWSKAYIMERERFDGADVAHLLLARGESLDWPRLLRRFGPHWRLLLAHLILFTFIYPGEASRIPDRVMSDLLDRLRLEGEQPGDGGERVCQGTLLSRAQYLDDLERRGYQDARLKPWGNMDGGDIDRWTEAIAVDGPK
jgi:hypothetical protein